MKKAMIAGLGLLAMTMPALGQDAEAGAKVFRKCKACHDIGAEAKNKVGPMLTGIIGAEAGAVEGFKYSDAMMEAAAGGMVWDAETLDAFLTKPKDVVPGTKMTFPGLRKEEDRVNVIAYIESQSPATN